MFRQEDFVLLILAGLIKKEILCFKLSTFNFSRSLRMLTTIGTDLEEAVRLLQAGEVVAIPTETVYGLAGNALNEDAILKIFEAKQRPHFNPLIIHIESIDQLRDYAIEIPDVCIKLAEKFSPGPITFLLEKKEIVPDLVTAGSNRVAIRIPAHPVAQELLKKTGFPLAAPSANPFGYVSPVSAEHVYQGLNGMIPYILDGGVSKVGLESTIVSFENDEVVIHRLGGVAVEDIEVVINKPVQLDLNHERPDTPGQLKSHYAPNLPLWVGDIDRLLAAHNGKRIAVISFQKKYSDLGLAYQFILSPKGNLREAAQNLFHTLREIDNLDADIILAEKFPEEGLGRAINDRLKRASVGKQS